MKKNNNNKTRILLIGMYYSLNLGDAVICDCTAHILRSAFPDAEIMISDLHGRKEWSTAQPESPSALLRHKYGYLLRQFASRIRLHSVEYDHFHKMLDLRRDSLSTVASTDCDAVVFAGGQLFMDSLAPYTAFLVRSFCARGIPVLFNACGYGSSYNKLIRQELRAALEAPMVKWISTRDALELIQDSYIPAGKNLVRTYDPGLYSSTVYNVTPGPCSQTVGLGIMYARSLPLSSQKQFWKNMIKALDRKKLHWQFFTNGDTSDETFANMILKDLYPGSEHTTARIAERPRSPEALVRRIASYQGIISFRLHSHIIACSLGVPSVAITWDAKLKYFFDSIHHPERCCSVRTDPDKIIEALLDMPKPYYDAELLKCQQSEASARLIDAVQEALTSS